MSSCKEEASAFHWLLGGIIVSWFEYEKFNGSVDKNGKRIREIKDFQIPSEIYILLGEYDKALNRLDHVLSEPTRFTVNILKLDPLYDPLRNLPGYKSLIEKYSAKSD